MANLTKTQINYFSERLSAATRKLIVLLEQKIVAEEPKPMSLVEKVHAIASGIAIFKFDDIMAKAEAGFALGSLEAAYDIPGVCDADIKVKEYHKRLEKFKEFILWQMKPSWVDDLVLGRIEDPDNFVQQLHTRVDEFYEIFKEGKF